MADQVLNPLMVRMSRRAAVNAKQLTYVRKFEPDLVAKHTLHAPPREEKEEMSSKGRDLVRGVLLILLAVGTWCAPALAQPAANYIVVSSCGGLSLTVNSVQAPRMDATGKICDVSTGGTVTSTGNITQWNGVTVSLGAGATDTGTLRVVLPTDQSALTVNLGTIAGVATAANQTTANTSLATIATNTTGASTAANQTTANTSLATIATNTTGASTAANQTTANTSLATIATNTTGVALAANQTSVIGTKAPGTAATNSLLDGGVYTAAGVTLTDGQQSALQLNSAGALVVTQPPSSTINVTVNTPPNDVIAGPTASTNGSLNDVTVNSQGAGSVAIQVTGTFTGFSTTFQGSVDGTNYVSVYGAKQDTCVAATSLTTISAGGTWIIAAAGFTKIRAHVTAVATGTANVSVNSSAGSSQQPNCSYATGANAVNLAQVNGITALAGAGATGTGSARVTAAQDTTTIAGSAPGTAGSASANVLSVQGIASMTPLIMQGAAASGASVSGNPLLNGARARSSEPTAVADGQAVALGADLTGKLIVSPYANKENFVQGAASSTSNAAVTIIASAGGSLKNYITAVQCYRSDAGTSAITVTFNDSASTVIVLPNGGGGGGSNAVFPVPLATAAATAFQFTPGTSTTTVYCNAQGYKGT